MSATDSYNRLLARKVVDEMERRHIDACYCATKEDALRKALEMIPTGSTVSTGGSATLREMGLIEALKAGAYRYLDPLAAQGGPEKERIAHEALSADWYLMSANAIAATGELVNIDGIGNRVGALCFGPKRVIVIAGMNKVEPDLETAIGRAKKRAAPMTMLLWKQDYASFDALLEAAGAACGQMLITRMSPEKGRISVILVGETLGF